MHRSTLKRFFRHEVGQSLVELALLLPVLAVALIGAADLARGYALQMAVQNGARAGAESYAVGFTPTAAGTIARSLDEMDRTPGMRWNCLTSGNSCHDSSAPGDVVLTVKQSDGTSDCISPPSVATPCFVTVQVKYTFRTIAPWPLVPNIATFDRSTTMRTFY